MGRLMPSHTASRHDGLPSLEQLELLIERTDATPHHWYWLGTFADDGDMRYATTRHNNGTFVVARVLWTLAKNVSLVHRSLRNDCGLVTCVNPDHFSLVEPKSGRFSLPDDCELSGGDVANVVRVDFTTTHILIEGAERYVCDRKRAPATKIVPNGIEVTCKPCLRAWRSLGRPLVPCS